MSNARVAEMNAFDMQEALAVLERTPAVLRALLGGLPEAWVRSREREDAWSPYDVVGHLIHGEKTDWIPRAERILEHGAALAFEPFDRTAMFEASRGKTMAELLDELAALRAASLERLGQVVNDETLLERRGLHPELGAVTMRQLLATWVAHDLSHLVQVARTMARRYRADVGPWSAYMSVLAED